MRGTPGARLAADAQGVAVRVIGGVAGLVVGVVGMILAGGTVLASLSEGHSAWILGVFLAPLAATSLSGGWAALARRRVRPVLGVGLAATALVYSAVVIGLMFYEFFVHEVFDWSLGVFVVLCFVSLLSLWLAVVLLTLLAAILLRGQRVRGFPLFLGTALAWVAAWVGFWIIVLPGFLVIHAFFLVIHAFFLLPALLALLLGRWATRAR